jgi:hypothetical protein
MAIGYGLGLAFQGTPKDYVELVKSKQAAQQKAALNKATKDAARLQRTYDDFIRQVGTSSVLPINEKDVMNELNTFRTVMDAETEKDSPDFNTVTQAATQAVFNIKQMAAKKKAWDPIRPNAIKYGFTPEEVAAIDSETDPVKLQAILNENGSGLVNYDPTTNAMSFTPVSDFKPLGESLEDFFKVNSGQIFNTPETGKQTKIDKTNILYYGVDPNTKSIFVTENLNTPSANVNFETALRRSGHPIPQRNTDEYLIKQTEFLGNAFEADAKNRYKREKIGSGATFNINIGGDKGYTPGAISNTFQTNKMGGDANLSYGQFSSFPVDTEGITNVPSNFRNSTTLEPISASAGKFKTGPAILTVVASRDINVNVRGKTETIKKGEVIPDQYQNQVYKTYGSNAAKVGIVVVGEFVPTGGGTTQPVFASSSEDAFTRNYIDANKDGKPIVGKAYKDLMERLNKLNSLTPSQRDEIFKKYGSWTEYLNSNEPIKTSTGASTKGTTTKTTGKTPYDREYWKSRGGFPAWQKSATGK